MLLTVHVYKLQVSPCAEVLPVRSIAKNLPALIAAEQSLQLDLAALASINEEVLRNRSLRQQFNLEAVSKECPWDLVGGGDGGPCQMVHK